MIIACYYRCSKVRVGRSSFVPSVRIYQRTITMPRSFLRPSAAFIVLLLAGSGPAFALAPPHNTSNDAWSITCSRCHYSMTGPTPTWATLPTTIDDTLKNNLCASCHSASGMPLADPRFTDVKTHSAAITGSTEWGGNWSVECVVCHNPHYQQQSTTAAADTEPGGNVLTGTVSAVSTAPSATTSTLFALGANFPLNEYVGYLLVPDRSRPATVYRIRSNTASAFTVDGAINPNYTGPGRSFAVRYGKLVNGVIDLPARKGGNPAVTGAFVKFYNSSGPNSFATGSIPVQGICMVCHTRAASFRNDGTLEGAGHPPSVAGTNCTQCHRHASGFKPECGNCHGNPPTVATPGGPNGLADSEGGTGSATPGAHRKHAVTLGYDCVTCHSGGMPFSAIYDKKVQIGFTIANGAYRSGAYDGRTSLANGYTYTAGDPGTTVTTGGSMVCANVYCHGSTMTPNGGADVTPVWTSSATGACGTCHGAAAAAPPTRGSHYQHSRTDLLGYAYPCGICHKDPAADASQHVNGQSEVVFSSDPKAAGGSYDGTPAMLDAYGACTNVYCHSTVQSSPPGSSPVYRVTPTWGGMISSCGSCHDYAANLTTGSHGKHMQQPLLQECWVCHNYNKSDDGCMACHDAGSIEPQRDRHADRRIDVAFAPTYSGSYSGTPAPGDAYGTCANVYCHSTVQGNPNPAQPALFRSPAWGAGTTGVCGNGACHDVGYAHPTVAMTYPLLTTGSHATHLRYKFDQDGTCQACHYDPGYATCDDCHLRTIGHADHGIDVVFDPAFPKAAGGASGSYTGDTVPRTAYGSCSDLYCHSPGTAGSPPFGAPAVTAIVWGGAGLPADCTGCHGGDQSSARPLTTGSHGRHVQSAGNDCSVCHRQTVSASRTLSPEVYLLSLTYGYRNHSNGWVNISFPASAAVNGTYAGQASPITYRVPGSVYGACGNTYCHSTGTSLATGVLASNSTPTWGTGGPLGCTVCHGSEMGNDGTGRPWYANGSPKANSHRSAPHVDSPCSDCHYGTTTTGTTITNSLQHANGTYDVAPNGSAGISFSYAFSTGGGVCSSVSCHVGSLPGTWGQ